MSPRDHIAASLPASDPGRRVLRWSWLTLAAVLVALYAGLGGWRLWGLLPLPAAVLLLRALRRSGADHRAGHWPRVVLATALLTLSALPLPLRPGPGWTGRQRDRDQESLQRVVTGVEQDLEGLLERAASQVKEASGAVVLKARIERAWLEAGFDRFPGVGAVALFRPEGGPALWSGSAFLVPEGPSVLPGPTIVGDSLGAILVRRREVPEGVLTAAVLLDRRPGAPGPAPGERTVLERRLPGRIVSGLVLRGGPDGAVTIEPGPAGSPATMTWPLRGPVQVGLLGLILLAALGLLGIERSPIRAGAAAPILYAAVVPLVLRVTGQPLEPALLAPSWSGHQLTNQAFLAVAAAAVGLWLLLRQLQRRPGSRRRRAPPGPVLLVTLGLILLWGLALALTQDLYRFAPTWFWERVAFLPTGRDLIGWLIAIALTMAALLGSATALLWLQEVLGRPGGLLAVAAALAGGAGASLLGAWDGSLWVGAVTAPGAVILSAWVIARARRLRVFPLVVLLALLGAGVHLPLKWETGRLLNRQAIRESTLRLAESGVGLTRTRVSTLRDRILEAGSPTAGGGTEGEDRYAYLLWRSLALDGTDLAGGVRVLDGRGRRVGGFVTSSELFAAPVVDSLQAAVAAGQGRIALTGGSPGFFGEETLLLGVPVEGGRQGVLVGVQRRPLGFLATGEERLWSRSDPAGEVERSGRLSSGLYVRVYDEAYRLLAEPRTVNQAPEAPTVPAPVVAVLVDRRGSGTWYRRGWWGVTGADEYYFWLETPTPRPAVPGGAVSVLESSQRRIACVGLVRPGLWGRVVEAINLALLFVGTLALLFGLPFALVSVRGVPLRRRLRGTSFQTRLLIPLLVVALVPMVALWLFTRTFILDREAAGWEQDLNLSLRRVQQGLLERAQRLAEEIARSDGGAGMIQLPAGSEWARFDAGLVRVSGNLSDELADRIPAREAVLGRGPRSFMLRTDRIWSIALAPTVRGFAGGAALVALPLDDDALRAAATGSAWEVDLFLDGRLRYATDPAPYTAGLLPRQLSAATDWEGRGGSELPTFAWGGIRGMRHLSAYRPLTDYVGLTVGTISQRRFGFWGLRDPDLDRLFATVASIYLLLVGAVTLVAVLIARRISEPVGELTRSVRRVSGGDLEVNIPVTRGDEVGGLQKAFRQMLIALRENRDRLAQAERERAWQQMARQVAHEIKNPLTPMRLSAQFLRKAYDEQAEGLDRIVQECTDSIAEQVEELRRIANEFSAYARLPVVERVLASLNGPIEDALNLFLPALPDGVRLERELDPDLPEVPLDPEQVRRVVINLIRNALDAMGEWGVLTVRSGRAPDAVWLQVTDTGEGIAPEVQERLFEPYFSTKTDGTGLGLAITRAVVDAHGGSLLVESRSGEGTTMTARFPLS
jgi:signal transduction histidine kinase